MYTQYFGLTEKPFAIAPNPRYLYMSELHREALAHLLYGINGEGCIILLTGDIGTGKTTMCRCLIDQLPETTDIAIILNSKLTITDLLKTICEELEISILEELPSVKTYIDCLNTYLFDAHSKGRNTTLIIDEAQNLEIEVLEQLRLLTNLETNSQKLLQIVLIGQPELQKIITDPKLSQLNQRITSKYHLKPLEPDDVSSYIHHRLTIAGCNPRTTLFSKKAIQLIIKASSGIPRVINSLCDRALLGAYAEDKDHVDQTTLKRAVQEVANSHDHKWPFVKKSLIAMFIFLLMVWLPVSCYLLFEKNNSTDHNQTSPQPSKSKTIEIQPVQILLDKSFSKDWLNETATLIREK